MNQAVDEPDKQVLAALVKQALNESSKTAPLDALTEQKIHDIASDRTLKQRYANGLIALLFMQLLLMNIIFIGQGSGLLKFADSSIEVYMAGTLAEVFGLVVIITRSLFPSAKKS